VVNLPNTVKFFSDVGPESIPNDASHEVNILPGVNILAADNDEIMALAFGAFFGGALFGGPHCLAWNSHFPTPGEALGWRICSITTTCLPFLSLVPISYWMSLNPYYRGKRGTAIQRMVTGLTCFLFLVIYVLARLFLLVEIFRDLGFLPPEAFIDIVVEKMMRTLRAKQATQPHLIC
jgi:hypothetical protein